MARFGGTPPAVRSAAERVLADLAGDPEFAAHVAQAEVDRLVANGSLIPRERLQLGPGLELTPVGRLSTVEDALLKALAALEQETPDVDAALVALSAVAVVADDDEADPEDEDTDDVEDDDVEVKPEPDPAKARKPAAKKSGTRRSEVVKKTSDGRPVAMPTEDEIHHCTICGEVAPYPISKMSWIKGREVRCEEHFNTPSAKAS
jgi:hypothetical protein